MAAVKKYEITEVRMYVGGPLILLEGLEGLEG